VAWDNLGAHSQGSRPNVGVGGREFTPLVTRRPHHIFMVRLSRVAFGDRIPVDDGVRYGQRRRDGDLDQGSGDDDKRRGGERETHWIGISSVSGCKIGEIQ